MSRVDIVVPSYGMTETDCYVEEWFVQTGDRVEIGTPLLSIETAKAQTEIESPVVGVVSVILVAAGAEAAPGTILTWIDSDEG